MSIERNAPGCQLPRIRISAPWASKTLYKPVSGHTQGQNRTGRRHLSQSSKALVRLYNTHVNKMPNLFLEKNVESHLSTRMFYLTVKYTQSVSYMKLTNKRELTQL